METKASVKQVRLAPRKLRTVVDMVRGKDVAMAQGILASNNKLNISRILTKLLNQALANAKENMNLDVDTLYIKTITVDGGPSLKRFLPRMRGKADQILKRTSSILIILDERTGKAKKVVAANKPAGAKAEKSAAPKGEKKSTKSESKKKGKA